jgi:PLP dependent protein
VRDAYREVQQRIADAAIASGRQPQEVHLVAVTKTASPDEIRQLYELGHRDFGESRVQQLAQRATALEEFVGRKRFLSRDSDQGNPADAHPRWHMIGHLQRNKVKHVAPVVKLVHSVDSLRLAEELHAFGAKMSAANNDEIRPIDMLLQVNASGEDQKFGLTLPAVAHFAEQIDTMIHLRLRGLMCMAEQSSDVDKTRATFTRTAELFQEIKTESYVTPQFNILSMGMSNDYEIAIECGANLVRVGRAIFGDIES